MHRLPHRETPPSQEKHPLGLDRQIYGAREPLLFLLCRRQLRSFLPEVLFLLSLPCQVVPERTGIRPPPIGSRRPGTLASAPAPTPSACPQSAIPCRPKKSIRFYESGSAGYLIPFRPQIGRPGTATRFRSCQSNYP